MSRYRSLTAEMGQILRKHGITPQAIADALREFYEAHSCNKLAVVSFYVDGLSNIERVGLKKFMEKKKNGS